MLKIEPWVVILAIISALLAPSVVIWRIKGKFKAYLQNDHQRIIKLEGEFDANRESSGLSKKGQHPDGEP